MEKWTKTGGSCPWKLLSIQIFQILYSRIHQEFSFHVSGLLNWTLDVSDGVTSSAFEDGQFKLLQSVT